jgi:hypothetical protein
MRESGIHASQLYAVDPATLTTTIATLAGGGRRR